MRASRIFDVSSQRAADRAERFAQNPSQSRSARHRVSARRLARPKSAKRSGRQRPQARSLQAGRIEFAKLSCADLPDPDLLWVTPSTSPMLARLGRSDGALPTPRLQTRGHHHQNRSGRPSATQDTAKASRNWFGGIVSFLAKKSLPTTSRNWLTNTGARRENAVCLISQVQNGPAELSLFAHRITCFRSHSRLCWDLLSVLELPGCAGRRACAHLLGKRNGHYSEHRWGNAVRVKSNFVHLGWRDDFRRRMGDNGCREPKSPSSGMKNAPPTQSCCAFRLRHLLSTHTARRHPEKSNITSS